MPAASKPQPDDAAARPEKSTGSWRLAAFEVAWIFLIFFLFAASPPPDVGESHYLVKARHYWQPEWCAGDLFLESRDAHAIFYWTFGWVTRFCSLTATAWIGRALSWLLLAWSWRRLSWAVVPQPLVSLLSAGLLLVFLRHFHLAGEWIVGGVEAKCFAYVLVFLALEAIVHNSWGWAIVLAGAAGAFHVLVGGWAVVTIGLAWLWPASDRPPLVKLLPAACLGFLLSLPGLLPAVALNRGIAADIQDEAARVYVFERLAHHLVLHSFESHYVFRFEVLAIAWAVMIWFQRKDADVARLQRVVAGALVVALIGVLVDQWYVGQSDRLPAEVWQTGAAKLLRYYWFRLADSFLPIGAALGIVNGLYGGGHVERFAQAKSPADLRSPLAMVRAALQIACSAIAVVNVADVYHWRSKQWVPAAILQPRPTEDSARRSWFWQNESHPPEEFTAERWYRDWQAVCDWVAEQTPADALFLTPREQQTFKWYAGRAEIVNWKDVPQDAQGLLEWKRRMDLIYPSDKEHHRHDLAAFTDQELLDLAREFRAQYLIVDLTRAQRRIGLPQLYPQPAQQNSSFAVFRLSTPVGP